MQRTLEKPMDEHGRALERRHYPRASWAASILGLEILRFCGGLVGLGYRNHAGLRCTPGNFEHPRGAAVGRDGDPGGRSHRPIYLPLTVQAALAASNRC